MKNKRKKVGAFKLIPHKRLIVEYYMGDITMDDLIRLKKEIAKEPNYNFSYNTIIDFRDANLLLEEDDFNKMIHFIYQTFNIEERRTVAYITHKPNEVVHSILFVKKLDECQQLNMAPKVFSTVDAACRWMNSDLITKQFVNQTLHQLKVYPNNVL